MNMHRPERIDRLRLLLAYGAAVVGPCLVLALRMRMDVYFAHRPLLIIFVLPILIAAYLGGLRPGLLATGLCAVLTDYFLIPPTHSLTIAASHDTAQWTLLIVTGLGISALTERLHRALKQAAGSVRLQDQLADVAASLPGVLYSFQLHTDGHTSFPYSTDAFDELLGLDSEAARRDAAFTFARIRPDDAERLQASFRESAASLTPWRGEFRLRHPVRGEIWIEGRSTPRRLADGSTLWHGYAEDVTERKNLERAVQEARMFMQGAMDSLGAHVCVLDERGTIVAVNKAWRDFAAANPPLSTRAAEGANYLDACSAARGEDAPLAHAFAQGIRDVLAARADSYEAEYPCHSPAEQRWFVGRVTRFTGSDGGHVVVAHVDITRRKLAEMAVARSEYLHRALIETIPDLIWLKDPDGVYLSCNPTFERLYGKREADIIGKTDRDFVSPELADFFRANDLAAISDGKPRRNEEWLTFAADGYRGYFETIKAPVRDSTGRLVGVLGIARDITARKETETERTAKLDELHRWQAMTLGREDRILELKREVNGLARRLGLPPTYAEHEPLSPR